MNASVSPTPTYSPPNNDAEHLRLLSIFHYVFAGLVALFSCVWIIHIVLGITMMQGVVDVMDRMPADGAAPRPRPEDFKAAGTMFAVIGGALVLAGWTFAALICIAGRKLAAHRGRSYCIVIAALCCALVPLGTILGVFTLIVLTRPSVQALFAAPDRMQPW